MTTKTKTEESHTSLRKKERYVKEYSLVSNSLEFREEIKLVDELQLATEEAVLDIVLAKVGLPDQELVVIGDGVPPLEELVSDEQLFSESLIMEWVAIMKSTAPSTETEGFPLNIFDLVWT